MIFVKTSATVKTRKMAGTSPLNSSISALVVVSTAVLHAGDEPELNDEEVYTLPDYTVTDSHIRSLDFYESPALREIDSNNLALWSDQSPISALRREPFFLGNVNTDRDSNGGAGTASVNLRGVGNLSTLTLINGRRAGGNSALGFQHGGFANLNLIPSSAIESIEIATDGTSVAYGSDAVAGTVNLRLHRDYTGNRVSGSYSDTTEGDMAERSVSFLTGQEIGKGHLVVMGEWYKRDRLNARDREVSKDADRRDQGGINQGSLSFPGRIQTAGAVQVLNPGVSFPTGPADYFIDDPTDPTTYNYNELAPAVPELERKSVMLNYSHELTPQLELWTELLFTENTFENGLAPAPWDGNAFSPALLNAAQNSPYLGNTGVAVGDLEAFTYRSFELGNLDITQEHEALRALLGLRGEIDEWNWEAAGLWIDSDLEEKTEGIADTNAMIAEIQSGAFNPFANAFAIGPGFDNAASLRRNQLTTSSDYNEKFWSFDAKANGPLWEIRGEELIAAFGIEVRHEEIDIDIDPNQENGNTLGLGAKSSYAAERDVAAGFVEGQLALFDNGSQRLTIGASGRFEDYEDSSKDSSLEDNEYDAFVYKGIVSFQANPALTFRASYGTSFRAPTLSESYGAPFFAFYIYDDDQTPDQARIPTQISGNPDLDPEESENINVGFVFQPEPDRGWRASVEYYRIETEDKIVNSGQTVVDSGGAFRNPDSSLSFVIASWFNAAELTTDGIDYDVSYRLPTNNGFWEARLGVNQVLTYEIKATENSPTVSYLDRIVDPRQSTEAIAGPGSIPRYKGYAQLIWKYEALTLSGIINYVDDLDDNEAFTNDGDSREINSWTTLDLAGSYAWDNNANALLRNTVLTLGIENAFDEEPPFAAGAFADGYDSSLYNIDGRRISISLRREF